MKATPKIRTAKFDELNKYTTPVGSWSVKNDLNFVAIKVPPRHHKLVGATEVLEDEYIILQVPITEIKDNRKEYFTQFKAWVN